MIDRAAFFTAVRDNTFSGHLTQSQVDGMNTIIDAWEQSGFDDLRWLAYMLGTAYHETARTMQPIHEFGGDAYFTRMYDITGERPEMAQQMGNTESGDGIKYCGRGFVQLTWKNNYQKMGAVLGQDLVGNPDLAMQPAIASKIMIVGMTATHLANTFSGVNLQRYFNDSSDDWVAARHIINGQDHAQEIADTAQDFGVALGVVAATA
jgi:hypothetical protein